MAIVCVTAEVGCPVEEIARLAATRLQGRFVTDFDCAEALVVEFGGVEIPAAAWPLAVGSIVCRMAASHHLVLALTGAEFLEFPGALQVQLVATEMQRVGFFMLEHRVDRTTAKRRLAVVARKSRARFTGLTGAVPDLTLHMNDWTPEQVAYVIAAAVECRSLALFADPQFEFDLRLKLAAHGVAPVGIAPVKAKTFSHPSEELFANLLGFYRIPWLYEPRRFPLQWNESGAVTEAFTPDFYLPETDLYVELTTMKQSLVTKKNRKVKLLKAIYPHINIQIFYQKDFQEFVFKYGL